MHAITRYRIKRDISQQALADRIGVTKYAVSRWERGNRYPSARMLVRISQETGIAADELLPAAPPPR